VENVGENGGKSVGNNAVNPEELVVVEDEAGEEGINGKVE